MALFQLRAVFTQIETLLEYFNNKQSPFASTDKNKPKQVCACALKLASFFEGKKFFGF
jgi:hypothetical protein